MGDVKNPEDFFLLKRLYSSKNIFEKEKPSTPVIKLSWY